MTMSKPSTGAKHRLLVSTAMLGVLCLGYGRRAYAACSGAGGTYNCTGALTTTQTLNSATLSVTTTAPFSISTTAGDAFDLTATTGSLTFTDNNTSTITGFGSGISATNNGSGDLMITTTGTVTGNGAVFPNAGIYAKNYREPDGQHRDRFRRTIRNLRKELWLWRLVDHGDGNSDGVRRLWRQR
jgi:hypothetical protein